MKYLTKSTPMLAILCLSIAGTALFFIDRTVQYSSQKPDRFKTLIIRTNTLQQKDGEQVKLTSRVDGKVYSPMSLVIRKEDKLFWQHQAAFDNSIRLLVDQYENADSARIAIRPYGSWWIPEYLWLIEHVKALGYKFESFDSYDGGISPKNTVYIRYDIHLRDISPLFIILDANYLYDIPSVSFINWDFEKRNRLRRNDYQLIRKFDNPLHRYALHASPVSGYLGNDLPNDTLVPWIRSGKMKEFFQRLVNSNDGEAGKQKIVDGAAQTMRQIVSDFAEEFPEAKLFSFHGSGFDRTLNSMCTEDNQFCQFQDLTTNRMGDVIQEALGKKWLIVDNKPINTVTDSASSLSVLCQIDRLSEEQTGYSLLIHPAQMLRNRRLYSQQGISLGERAPEGLCK